MKKVMRMAGGWRHARARLFFCRKWRRWRQRAAFSSELEILSREDTTVGNVRQTDGRGEEDFSVMMMRL